LRARLASAGSTLYTLTWKERGTPSGLQICALRASVPRTAGSDSGSWPIPVKEDARSSARHGYMITGNQGTTLLDAARMASWSTPLVSDLKGERSPTIRRGTGGLPTEAKLASWATPVATEIGNTLENYRAMKANMTSGPRTAITHPSLQAQLVVSGIPPNGSPAQTASRGQLNPEHSRWLMGFPRAWASCVPTEMPSSPRSRRPSSNPR
jgi:hypothetical protein